MKHIYQNIPGFFDFKNMYDLLIKKLPNNFVFVEVGVWLGKSLSYFVIESQLNHKQGKIYAVDHWLGSKEHLEPNNPGYNKNLADNPNWLYQEFLKHVDPIKNSITIIKQSSLEASKLFDSDSIDAAYIDGSHEYDDVKEDIRCWFDKIKSGGILSGHDYPMPGVKRAINEFADSHNLDIFIKHNAWLIHKP